MSVVDWLKARGRPWDLEARRALFHSYFPGEGYHGSAAQNLRLLARLEGRGGAAVGGPQEPTRVTRVVGTGEDRVVLDLATQVLSLELREDVRTEYVGWDRKPGPDRVVEPDVLARLPVRDLQAFVPAAVLALQAKQFDDGLYAAVEEAVQQGPAGKSDLLRAVADRLAAAGASGTGAEVVFAAAALGEVGAKRPPSVEKAVRARLAAFEADEARSKPLGFYTWTPTLARVFRQDRMLQTEIAPAEAPVVAAALDAAAGASDAYARILALYEGLTNSWSSADFRSRAEVSDPSKRAEPVRFFPPSRSFEVDLIHKHWGGRPVPEGASAFQLLIDEVRAGRASLRPTERSGWYDRVAWSLEPLIRPEAVPESAKLTLGRRYRTYLGELFKGLLALARETHVKQLGMGEAGAAAAPRVIHVGPGLTVEPLPTHYARRAEAYAFVRGVLERHFGEEGLAALRRVTAEGPIDIPLDVDLAAMEALFRGAAATARAEIGLPDLPGETETAADRERFAAFRALPAGPPDLARDLRMMVPVFFDVQRRKVKAWVFLGWTAQVLDVRYEKLPTVRNEPSGKVHFAGQWVQVFSPVVAEVYVSRLLDRDEFRRHCDRFKTRTAILQNLP